MKSPIITGDFFSEVGELSINVRQIEAIGFNDTTRDYNFEIYLKSGIIITTDFRKPTAKEISEDENIWDNVIKERKQIYRNIFDLWEYHCTSSGKDKQ